MARYDPESLPNMPYQQWRAQPPAVWNLVAEMIRDGWFAKVKEYYESKAIAEQRAYADRRTMRVPPQWLTYDCAIYAQSLGAPVGRFFTAAAIMVRDRGSG